MRDSFIGCVLSCVALASVLGGGDACLAGGEGFLVHASGNRLVIGTGDDSPGGQQFGQRVLGDRLPSSGVNRDPSFFSFSTAPAGLDALPIGEFIHWDFLPLTIDGVTSNLFHWDSAGAVEFAPADGEKLSLFDVTNSVPATVDGSAEAVPGERLGSVTGDFLSLHAHNFWALQGEGGDPLLGGGVDPASGVYLAALRLRVDGYVPTKPFFVALATSDTPTSAIDSAAVPWIESNVDDLILRGDYNFDGLVDSADLELWRTQYGAATPQPIGTGEADGNFDGRIDAADYTVWRDQMTAGSIAVATTVPEPGGVMLVLTALSLPTRRRRS